MGWKDDLNYGLAAFGVQIPETLPIDQWVGKLTGAPAKNTGVVVLASAAIFYAAEREHNPKVADIYDAMVYCSTCLSVGYGDIFARTPVGKMLGSLLMTLGPSLSGQVMDATASAARDALQAEVLATLRQILDRMPPSPAA